jgi:hypothetical protein
MPTKQSGEDSFLSLVLPKDTLNWFDIKSSSADEETLYAILVEKNNPPKEKGKLTFKGYKDITITDFPIRGRRTELTFRRRYWSEPGAKQLVANDIKLAFPGTKLEKEFADFLKDEGGDSPYITFVYSDSLQPDIQRVRETIQRPPL